MSNYISASLRRRVYERAGGQCEYCLIPQVAVFVPHEIDHIVARKHGGQTEADNLALACSVCNKRKGSDLTSIDPDSGEITPLYHPRQHRWLDHFNLDQSRITPKTPIGRATVALLQFNQAERIAEREILLAAGAISMPE